MESDKRGRDRSSPRQRHEVVAPVDPARRRETLDDLRRFMDLANQMREENAAGMIDAEPVEPDAAS